MLVSFSSFIPDENFPRYTVFRIWKRTSVLLHRSWNSFLIIKSLTYLLLVLLCVCTVLQKHNKITSLSLTDSFPSPSPLPLLTSLRSLEFFHLPIENRHSDWPLSHTAKWYLPGEVVPEGRVVPSIYYRKIVTDFGGESRYTAQTPTDPSLSPFVCPTGRRYYLPV